MKEPVEYRGYHIMCFHEFKDHGNLFDSWAKAYSGNEPGNIQIAICESTQIGSMAALAYYTATSENEVWQKLESRTIAKIKARVDFELFDFGAEYIEVLHREQAQDKSKQKISITDRKIELDILSALKRIRTNNPRKYEYDCLEIAGYAYIHQIDLKHVEFLVGVLIEEKFVQHNKIEQTGIPEGGFFITAPGLDYLEKLQSQFETTVHPKNEIGAQRDLLSVYEYDVALSFSGEDREYVDYVADHIKQAGFRVFYDKYEEVSLWGEDLYQRLHKVYSKLARYCIIFVSEHYASKVWPRHELRSAQERALKENYAYILPVRLDDTELPGLPSTVHYFDARTRGQDELVKLILAKLATNDK